jgi:hypothetical protein
MKEKINPETGEITSNSILDILANIERGVFVANMSDDVREVVKASMENMKKGSITLKLNFDPDPKTGMMRVAAEYKVAIPSAPQRASLFFPDDEGNLDRMDRRQSDMFIAGEKRIEAAA